MLAKCVGITLESFARTRIAGEPAGSEVANYQIIGNILSEGLLPANCALLGVDGPYLLPCIGTQSNGKVLLAVGNDSSSTGTTTLLEYDPNTDFYINASADPN